MPRRDLTEMSRYGNALDFLVKRKKGQGISGNLGAKTFPKDPFADVSGFNPYILTQVDEMGKLRRGVYKKPEELIAHGYVYDATTKGWALPTETPIGTYNTATGEETITPGTTTEVHHERGTAPTTPLPTNMFNVAPDIFGQGLQIGATVVLDGINPDGTYRWRVVSQPTGGGKAVNTF
jgi:hypothetical protein